MKPGTERFARVVFRLAGVYGLLVVAPMYFLEAPYGREHPPAINHPEFFYGFVGVTLAFQFVFLVMSTDPVRYRPLIPAAVFEKWGYVAAMGALWFNGRIPAAGLAFPSVDFVLGILFLIAWLRLPARASSLS